MDLMDVQSWPAKTELCTLDDVPLHRDCVLIGSDQFEELNRIWKDFFASGAGMDHPNNHLRVRWCALKGIGADSCEVNICVTKMSRYHGAVKTLPRSKFIVGVYSWDYAKRRYLVVDQQWFDQIEQEPFSLYALVDVIGMKKLLDKHGRVDERQLTAIREGIDALAARNPDHAFLTFADNVLVKTLWRAAEPEYDATYKPEQFLGITEEIDAIFAGALGLHTYVVATQGANYSEETSLLQISPGRNHVFFGSLATPFVEIFEIDKAIRAALQRGTHGPKELYLSESLFLTLQYTHYQDKDELKERLFPFTSKINLEGGGNYLAIDRDELRSRLRYPEALTGAGRNE